MFAGGRQAAAVRDAVAVEPVVHGSAAELRPVRRRRRSAAAAGGPRRPPANTLPVAELLEQHRAATAVCVGLP